MLAGLFVVGSLGIGGMTCDSDGTGGDGASGREQSGGAGGDEEGDETSGSAKTGVLPGDTEAGEREPESPGPEGAGVFFLAGLKGYLEPCGCTADVLLGGAERIVGYVRAARELYGGSMMVDGGDTFFEEREIPEHLVPQERAKADVIAAMHRAMETRAMVPGERDFALGAEFYLETARGTGAEVLGANLAVAGEALPATAIREVGEWRIGVVGAVQPELFEGIDGVEAGAAEPAVAEAIESLPGPELDATVVLFHGGLKAAKQLLAGGPAVDFVVVGHDPREPGGADAAGNGYTLEAFDQGRYVGVLKLFGADQSRPFVDAQPGSESELAEVEEKIAHVEQSLEKVAPEPGEEAPPIQERLQDRLKRLREKRQTIEEGELEVSEERRSFLYRSVAMKPGYPVAPQIRSERVEYNRELESLTKQVDREIPPVEEGEATYVGTNQCTGCHTEAHEFWKGTSHAGAMETLEQRDKAWDERCVKCHVVGYGEPGGSLVGKLEYSAEVDGREIRKNLRDVGCESCHGPGSKHRAKPVGAGGEPQNIESGAEPAVCGDCHVPEHSPDFEYGSYVRQVTGEGHELRTEPGSSE